MPEERSIECPLPSRLQLHGHTDTTSSLPTLVPHVEDTSSTEANAPRSRGILKGTALVLLAMTTIIVPMAGLLSSESSVSLPVKILSDGSTGGTWVDSADPQIEQASLDATLAAASKTRVRTPLLATRCVPEGGADGTRHIVRQSAVYWPMAPGSYQITSGFSWRISPISGELLRHEGVDMAGPSGTPIYSVSDGVVKEVAENSRSGAYVVIEHKDAEDNVYSSVYRHQYMDQIIVSVGQHVNAGQHIGHVGNNGWSTGPHLHFEILNSSGTAIDPVPFMENIGATFIGEECL